MQESQTRKIAILGAPVDSGASLRGCQMGPDAMRIAGMGEALQELGHEPTSDEVAEEMGLPVEKVQNIMKMAQQPQLLLLQLQQLQLRKMLLKLRFLMS